MVTTTGGGISNSVVGILLEGNVAMVMLFFAVDEFSDDPPDFLLFPAKKSF